MRASWLEETLKAPCAAKARLARDSTSGEGLVIVMGVMGTCSSRESSPRSILAVRRGLSKRRIEMGVSIA